MIAEYSVPELLELGKVSKQTTKAPIRAWIMRIWSEDGGIGLSTREMEKLNYVTTHPS